MQVTTISLDLAKHVFQIHGICGREACATAHYWARELTKLGHEVRLMPAKDVKAYVKRNKNDAADAEAICEAVRRPTMSPG
jgi:transposase